LRNNRPIRGIAMDKQKLTYLSADDFLAGVMGEAVDYQVKGLGWVKVRPLEYAEVQKLYSKYEKDVMALTFHVAVAGIAEPKLSEDQVKQLEKARAGVITDISKRIMELSGMSEAAELENLAGSGS